MKSIGKFILLDPSEFEGWVAHQNVTRKIRWIQLHHTYIPNYKQFSGSNHFILCQSMERSHKERGFSEIGQNYTIFPDGKIMVCRNINTVPAGIKGANSFGICVEIVGNFDVGNDIMSLNQKNSILILIKQLLEKFGLTPSNQSIIYHHWFDLNTGKRILKEGIGVTKSCPGSGFFGGNSELAFNTGLLPLLK